MGFERAESPSRVKGSALVSLGKAQQPRRRVSLKAKEHKARPRSRRMGFERAESLSRVKGSALVSLGKAQHPAGEFR